MPLLHDPHGVYLADVRPDRWWRRALHRLVSRISRRLDDAWDDVGWTDDEPTMYQVVQAREAPFYAAVDAKAKPIRSAFGTVIQEAESLSWEFSEPERRTLDAMAETVRALAAETVMPRQMILLDMPGPVDAETYRLPTGRDVRADVAANQLSAAVDDAHQLYAFLVRDVGQVAAFQHAKALADLRRRWGL